MVSNVPGPYRHAVGEAFGIPSEERQDHLLKPRQMILADEGYNSNAF